LLDQVCIVAQSTGWVAINKPAGLPSVPAKDTTIPHAVAWLAERFLIAGTSITWPATIHRLDMDTSGLLLLALTAQSQRAISAQFEQRLVQKRYVALLQRAPPSAEGEVSASMRADLEHRPRQVIDLAQGRPAHTTYRVVSREHAPTGGPLPEAESKETWSRVELVPRTGRTHQLRVHMASLGCPIVGDVLYGHGRSATAPRMMLHASMLTFNDPTTGLPVVLECPADF